MRRVALSRVPEPSLLHAMRVRLSGLEQLCPVLRLGRVSGQVLGAGTARVMPVPGYVDGSGGGRVGAVTVAKLDPRKWDTTVWLEHLANAARLIFFSGRSTVGYLTKAASIFNAKRTSGVGEVTVAKLRPREWDTTV